MKLIGYWAKNLRELALPLPQEFVGPMSAQIRDKVCTYLVSAQISRVCRGRSWCRFDCGAPPSEMGHCEYTDGEWVWPEGLHHYVRVHGVILPDEFIATVMSGKISPVTEGETASLDFWINWAKTKRSSVTYQRLLKAQTEALNAIPAVIDSAVADILRQTKVSQDTCMFSGCSRHALAGKKICARHSLSEQEIERLTSELFQLPSSF